MMAKHKQNNVYEDKIKPLTQNQELYFSAIEYPVDDETGDDAFVIAVGAAGTGKTFIAAVLGAELYRDKVYQKIVIIKPTIGPDSMGFLPGDIDMKYAPWAETVSKPIVRVLGQSVYDCAVKNKNIILQPLEYIRGETMDNSIIIVDEAQNLTIPQIKVTLTRIGKNSKMIFCADDQQIDLPPKEESGLLWLLQRIKQRNEGGIEIIRFHKKDSVRSGACRKALDIIED
jgi:phosphate starvation-inducible PhoH-like protein